MKIHQCVITIDNRQNPSPLTLRSITGPDGAGTMQGMTSAVSPAFGFAPGDTVAAGTSLSFTLTGGDVDTAGAMMVWDTGTDDAASNATITMVFQNKMSFLANDNAVSLTVTPGADPFTSSLLTYGVSYFEAASGDGQTLGRDYLAYSGDAYPVTANFTVGYNTFVESPPASPFLPGITHVVMLMLENRAFDHLLGQLYTADPPVVHPPGSKVPAANSTIENPINFDGLTNNPTFSNPTVLGSTPVIISPVPAGTLDVPNPDPGEGFLNTLQQIYGSAENPPTAAPGMQGFLSDYEATTLPDASQIMQYYTPSSLPVLSALARGYAVSDAWFSSVPSETTPNRAFSLAGTSNGYVDNTTDGKPATNVLEMWARGVRIKSTTLFNVLQNCGLGRRWAIYHQDTVLDHSLTGTLFEQVGPLADNLQPITNFFAALESDTLPAFSYLEPAWYETSLLTGEETANGNDYHPPANLCEGEDALAIIYERLTRFKHWDKTLFIVTFDEHGGTFDHVPPPTGVTAPDAQTDVSGFGFDRLGLRVPTLLISPRIAAGTVFRSPTAVPFDHTSLLKTILGWQGIDVSGGVMGQRAAAAPDVSGVLSTTVVNREVVTPSAPICPPGDLHDQTLAGMQKALLPLVAARLAGAADGGADHRRVMAELDSIETLGALRDHVRRARSAT
jgi:phospholipase C